MSADHSSKLEDKLPTAIKPRSIRTWLESLPATNISLTSRLIYKVLDKLEVEIISDKDRFEILELLYPYVEYFGSLLRKQFMGPEAQTVQKSKQIIDLTNQLQTKLSDGYHYIIKHSSHDELLKHLHDDDVATIIHRNITLLSKILFRGYVIYHPPSKSIWQQLHRLYQHAVKMELLDIPSTDPYLQSTVGTIEDAYKKSLLMSAANPASLQQNHIETLFDALDSLIPLAVLNVRRHPNDTFVINPDSDIAINYQNQVSVEHLPSNALSLDTSALVSHCQQLLRTQPSSKSIIYESPKDDERLATQTALLQQLTHTWSASETTVTKKRQQLSSLERAFNRSDASENIRVCFGLAASHYYISDKKYVPSGILARFKQSLSGDLLEYELSPIEKAKDTSYLMGAETAKKEDIWDRLVVSKETKNDPQTSKRTTQHIEFPNYEVTHTDTSPEGLGLKTAATIPTLIQPGLIVTMSANSKKSSWQIGIVKWVESDSTLCFRFGIKYLSPNPKAIQFRLSKKDLDEPSDFLRGLILPEQKALSLPFTILVPQFLFHSGDYLEVDDNGEIYEILLTKQALLFGNYGIFEYQKVEKTTIEKGVSFDDEQDEFDSVWSSL